MNDIKYSTYKKSVSFFKELKAPSTKHQLRQSLGVDNNTATAAVRILLEEGKIVEKEGKRGKVYEWKKRS